MCLISAVKIIVLFALKCLFVDSLYYNVIYDTSQSRNKLYDAKITLNHILKHIYLFVSLETNCRRYYVL